VPSSLPNLQNQICLLAERVCEHADICQDLRRLAVISHAGFMWGTAPVDTGKASSAASALAEHERLQVLVALAPSYGALISAKADMWMQFTRLLLLRGKRLVLSSVRRRVPAQRWRCLSSVLFHQGQLNTLYHLKIKKVSQKYLSAVCTDLEDARAITKRVLCNRYEILFRIHGHYKQAKAALEKSTRDLSALHQTVGPLADYLKIKTRKSTKHWEKASRVQAGLEEQSCATFSVAVDNLLELSHILTQRHATFSEASRAFASAGDFDHASVLVTYAAEASAVLPELVKRYPVLIKSTSLQHAIAALTGTSQSLHAACCFLLNRSKSAMAAPECNHCLVKMGCPWDAAVCASQTSDMRQALCLLDNVDREVARPLVFLSAAAWFARHDSGSHVVIDCGVAGSAEHTSVASQTLTDTAGQRMNVDKMSTTHQIFSHIPVSNKPGLSNVWETAGRQNEYVAVDCIVCQTSETEPARLLSRSDNCVFEQDAMRHHLDASVAKVVEALNTDEDSALLLLRHFRWNQEDLLIAFSERHTNIRQLSGISETRAERHAFDAGDICCLVCFEAGAVPLLHCNGHECCRDCWSQYLSAAIEAGSTCVDICCPSPNCCERVQPSLVRQLCPPHLVQRYNEFWIQTFVDESATLKWCPGKGCGRIGCCPELGKFGISCRCGLDWCFNCTNEEHYPLCCDVVQSWFDLDPNEEGYLIWASLHTKKCPRCDRPIETNGGCMHMTCRKPGGCGYEFCWLCLKDWRGHKPCNRIVQEQSAQASGLISQSDRYDHCLSRFNAHAHAQNHALGEQFLRMRELTESIFHNGSDDIKQFEFLIDITMQIADCRRILKWTYVYSFFLSSDSPSTDLFIFHQGQLEDVVDRLSEVIESTDWQQLSADSRLKAKLQASRATVLSISCAVGESFALLVRELRSNT